MAGSRHTALGLRTALTYLIPIAVVVFLLDLWSKEWAQKSLELGAAPRPFIGDLITLRLIYNPGAALSMASGMTWILTLVSVGVVVFICVVARRLSSIAWVVTLAMLLGGTLGNLADRLFRAPGFPEGHVVDFIDYGPFIGNVADIFIVGAAVLIGVMTAFGHNPTIEDAQVSDGRKPDAAHSALDNTEALDASAPLDSSSVLHSQAAEAEVKDNTK